MGPLSPGVTSLFECVLTILVCSLLLLREVAHALVAVVFVGRPTRVRLSGWRAGAHTKGCMYELLLVDACSGDRGVEGDRSGGLDDGV